MQSSRAFDELFDGSRVVRIHPADVRLNDKRCPQQVALKVRPDVPRPRRPVTASRALTDRPLGPLYEVLDLIEFEQLTMEEALIRWRAAPKRPAHPALVRWTEHAVRGYLTAATAIPAAPMVPYGEALEPVSRTWGRQRGPRKPGDPEMYEEVVAGRRYAGHGVRELRFVRTGSVENRQRDDVETAVAAGILAGGRPVLSSRWDRNPLKLGRFDSPRMVRLVEIGCADASFNVLFEGTPEEAYARYDSRVESHIDKVVVGGSYRPGESCGRCEAVLTCPAIPSVPGLLGVKGGDLPRRSWSVTTGRSYRRCPARAHMENLFLPRNSSAEENEAVTRGKAVHAWIENQHRRTPQRGCEPGDVPGPPEKWQYGGWTVTGLQARLGIQMIGDHALVCPLRDRSGDAEVHPERAVAVYDPDADTVVVAKADLLYRVAGRWALRETKTVKVLAEGDLLEEYPQLALAVLLARAGVLPGGEQCRVELERLTGSGPVVTEIEASAPDVVAQARRVLEAYVSPWHTDARYQAKPGKACEDCPFTQWCPDVAGRSDA
ncbi:PD-(D/E)XK nuclease family protein [Streptomyces achromogenes]|uniref:PD-(D/E)XK nuclease family protein n=1 Tax=Streptomyces achromogenes TaxID=67255 RepID=UPI003700E361